MEEKIQQAILGMKRPLEQLARLREEVNRRYQLGEFSELFYREGATLIDELSKDVERMSGIVEKQMQAILKNPDYKISIDPEEALYKIMDKYLVPVNRVFLNAWMREAGIEWGEFLGKKEAE
jgi:hypothetical protein